MNFDQSDWIVTLLMVVLGLSVLIAVIVIVKTVTNEAKEKKEKSARLAADRLAEEKSRKTKEAPPIPTKPAKPAKPAKPKAVVKEKPVHKDDVSEDDDLVAAAEVYLTYELKEQAITSLEKHLLSNPSDQRALDLLKKAEASS